MCHLTCLGYISWLAMRVYITHLVCASLQVCCRSACSALSLLCYRVSIRVRVRARGEHNFNSIIYTREHRKAVIPIATYAASGSPCISTHDRTRSLKPHPVREEDKDNPENRLLLCITDYITNNSLKHRAVDFLSIQLLRLLLKTTCYLNSLLEFRYE